MNLTFPAGKRFAFSIFDDTDHSTIVNIQPVYDLLTELGIRTTKSVWVYPPRGDFTGSCLLDDDYRAFILRLQQKGFEIGLHNVGDGLFTREEILEGIEIFNDILGEYPSSHANHVSNPDNIYWWQRRFEWPFSLIYSLFRRGVRRGGELEGSDVFWGDAFKRHIRYARNLTFNDINTLSRDPLMPYSVATKAKYSNYWFSSSDGHTVREMVDLLAPENIDRLESEGGVCIAYTHFASGFVDRGGRINRDFEHNIRYLASKSGWYVPVTPLLDFLRQSRASDHAPGYAYRLQTNLRWGLDRIWKRMRYGR